MDLGLSGKTAVVMAAGGGLGGAIAERLAAEGAAVAVMDRDGDAARATAARIVAAGGVASALTADLSDLPGLEAVHQRIADSLGPVDILVNNTGGPPPSAAWGVAPEVWRTHFEAMVLPVIRFTDLVLPGMIERGWGRIITSTSSGVVAPIEGLLVSNSLRSALVGWSKTLAAAVGARGVTANVILPGRIGTPRIRQLDEARAGRTGRSVEQVEAESIAQIPVGRYGDPQEYADTVAFLASRAASYVTGSVIRVDGGLIKSI